ncbi:MAG TPA: hypothetical protein VGJ31_02970 [Dongiaceae bacterium]|jgi:hypothetical protein
MKHMALLAGALALPLLALSLAALPSAALAADYQPWQGPYNTGNPGQPGDTQQLVKQLRQLIGKAEKAKAADPAFLRDLKDLADSYDNPWPNQIFFDNFSNGQYPDTRRWQVTAGNWRIVAQPSPGLLTQVNLQQQGQYGNNGQNVLSGLLGALISPQGGQSQNQQNNRYAGISAPVAIPNAFNLHFEFAATADSTRFDLGMYRGNNDGGYFLTYTPTAPRGLTLSAVTPGQGNQQIGTSNGTLNLNDRANHAIDWKRDRDGNMTVVVDGRPVMAVSDTSLRKPFDGFVMGNSGGSYIIRSVTITGGRVH